MKLLTLLLLIFVMSLSLNGQTPSFDYAFSQSKKDIGECALETPDSNFLIVTNQWTSGSRRSFILKLSKRGVLLQTLMFENDSINGYIKRLIPTSYGFLSIGGQATNGRYYLWLCKIDKQLNIINQTIHRVPNIIQELIADTDRDSNVIIGGSISNKNYTIPYNLFGAKVSKNGDLNYLKFPYSDSTQLSIDNYVGFFDYMITMKDSARHVFFDGYHVMSVDSNFRAIHKVNLPYINNFAYGLNPTALRVSDNRYYIGGRGFETMSSKGMLYFLEVTLDGRYYNFKSLDMTDTIIQTATKNCIDTTKNGNIYIGSTFNFPLSCQNPPLCNDTAYFVLHKMDKRLNVLWKKRYGKDGQFVMFGLLATSDGGCLMYGYRYLHAVDKKLEAYIIKVDGNGLVTSETAIPIAQESITAFPNPSTGQLNFKKETPSVASSLAMTSRFELSVFDISGKLVFQKKETDLSEAFDLSHLSTGNYIYQIKEGEKNKAIGKWVKIQ